jgi:photosystem II stability/assembly factor-like uncharacterized protein
MLHTNIIGMMGKKIWFLFVVILLSQALSAQDLQILSQPDIREIIRDVKFVDTQTGWISGNKGVIYKTTDGGKSWVEQNSGTAKDLVKISFVDANHGWSATIDGSVFKTSDGGETWQKLSYSDAVPGMVFSICDLLKFFDENTGFIIAGKLRNIYLLKSTDGGETWSVKDSLVSATLLRRWYDIDFYGSRGVLVGDKKEIQKYSTDFGETWTFSTAIVDGFFRDLKYVKFLTETEIVTIGEGNEFSGVPVPVYKSYDGGVTWVKKNQSLSTIYDRVRSAYFKNELEGIGVGSDGFSKAFVVKTSDGGETWSHTVLDYAFGLQVINGIGDFLFVMGTSTHFIYSTDFGDSWQNLPLKPPTSVVSITFKEEKGYAITRNGDLLYSSDGTGNSWEYLSHTGKNNSGAIVFLSADTGLVLKENKHIVKTTDGGQTWQTVLTPVNPSSRNLVGGMDFADLQTGYAWFSLNDYGEYHVYKTTDAGDTWELSKVFGGPGYISGDIIAFDADNVVILGPDTWTQRTTDGGISWEPAVLNNFDPYFASKDFEGAAKVDENRAIVIGELFICTTTDKGATWNYLNHGLNDIDSNFYKIAFFADTLGYIGLYGGTIIKTTDFGENWSVDETFKDQYLLFSAAINEYGKPFFGTSNGYIIGEETITSIKESVPIISSFSLEQNYPNPFNPSTKIKFTIPTIVETGHAPSLQPVSLKVFDLLGREVATLVDEPKAPGTYKVEFNAAGLPSGVLFYKLQAGNYVSVKKMAVIK